MNSLGYNLNNINLLYNDILLNTDFNTLKYKSIDKHELRVQAKTVLNNKVVTSGWMLEKDLSLRFITLIPGGNKKWNLN